jgi:lipoprotein LprG
VRSTRVRVLVGVLAAAVTAGLAGVTGCQAGGASSGSPRSTLAAAKRQLDDTSGVRIALSTPRLPRGISGLLAATGVGTHAPAFEGSITVASGGITADAAVVAVHGQVFARLPFSTRFVTVDPATYDAPDPAQLMSVHGGLSSLLTAAEHVQEGRRVRQGSVVLRSYTATVPGTAVAAVLPSASTGGRFDATFSVGDHQRLAKAVLTGPFYPHAADVTYTVGFDRYGIHPRIRAP